LNSSDRPLACPRCATKYPLDERFCPECGMPLTYAGHGERKPITDRHERARKIKPQYTEGALVRVAGGRNQAEAEMIQGMLLEEGIPSMLRRTRGFDVPDFLAAGPRDVMVPAAGYELARQVLLDAAMVSNGGEPEGLPGIGSPARLLTWVLIAVAGAAVLVWALYQISG
jgi:hypothetical protein